MNGQAALIAKCPAIKCKIYQYRMGKNPAKKGRGASAKTLKTARELKKIRQNTTIGLGAVHHAENIDN